MKHTTLLLLLLTLFFKGYSHTWFITSNNNAFTPDSLTITAGDTVIFQLNTGNNAQEVSFNTWIANDSLPVTGFQTPRGGDTITGLAIGTHYYVSSPNAAAGMKGQIVVLPKATLRFTPASVSVPESIGTVQVIAEVNNPGPLAVSYTILTDTFQSTASHKSDYPFTARTFTHATGISFDTVTIAINDELLIEPTETVLLRFAQVPGNAMLTADSVFTLSVLNNDTLSVSFLGTAFSYPETQDTAFIGVTISSPVPGNTSVMVVLDTGDAVKGVNFDCRDTTLLTFAANTADTLYIPVLIFEDTVANKNLQVNFNLIAPSNGARMNITAYTLFIIDDDFTGISEILPANSIPVYPVPACNNIIIEPGTSYTNMLIIDILGNTAQVIGNLQAGRHTIDISALPAGVYLLSGYRQGQLYTSRFIKAG